MLAQCLQAVLVDVFMKANTHFMSPRLNDKNALRTILPLPAIYYITVAWPYLTRGTDASYED